MITTRTHRWVVLVGGLAFAGFSWLSGCAKNPPTANVSLTGTGATLPAPLYEKWISEYAQERGVRIVYQAVGSSRGVEVMKTDLSDFGASDAPLTADEMVQAGNDVLHIPTTTTAVSIVYNIPGLSDLQLTGETLADLAAGKITRLSDPRVLQTNSGAKLPDIPLHFVHRADGSGTTKVFTQYLSLVSLTWKQTIGVRSKVLVPGLALRDGNSGVAEMVRTTPGAISYVPLNHARAFGLSVAKIWNGANAYVGPSLDSVTAATGPVSGNATASLLNSSAPGAYPISSFSYILVHEDGEDCAKRHALAQFLKWTAREGQAYAPFLHYAPLSPQAEGLALALVGKLRCQGKLLESTQQ